MIGEIAQLMLGTIFGALLGWLAAHGSQHSTRAGSGRTVAQIQARLELERRVDADAVTLNGLAVPPI
ncbi:hypothetical protein [Nocardia huaxiensis]|uniref:hypothetical protein n=1 Tax=Nocardia huaxiensis TaxID=2755382 RepID=UPI001E5250B1|nr:hypothetical protein [Nocardia huaxiensis]UFS99592.1 hypothetical protein LPY97_17745 [Nocardia huaxiensis]